MNVQVLDDILNEGGHSEADLELMKDLHESCVHLRANVYRTVSEMDVQDQGLGAKYSVGIPYNTSYFYPVHVYGVYNVHCTYIYTYRHAYTHIISVCWQAHTRLKQTETP